MHRKIRAGIVTEFREGGTKVDKITIYHNPRCNTSRAVLAKLVATGIAPEIVEYLKTPLDRAKLTALLQLLENPPAALVRNDKRFKELGLKRNDYSEREAVIGLLLKYPELMQRPVVVRGKRALIARPPERLKSLLD